MIKATYEEIAKKIQEESGVAREEIDSKVQTKLDQLSGLISKEGAAHIIANELGVKLFTPGAMKQECKINEIAANMRGVVLFAKVINKYEVRTFQKGDKAGQVASLLVGDDTGKMRVVFWDENHINQFDKLKEGDIIKVTNGYVKENNWTNQEGKTFNSRELHTGNKSEFLINPEGVTIEVADKPASTKKPIKELQAGDFAQIGGTIVQMFDPRFYPACPECNKKVNLADPTATMGTCGEHGEVTAQHNAILNFLLDDGTDNIRVVCFRDMVPKVLDKTDEEVLKYKDSPGEFEVIKNEAVGKQLLVTGKVNRNEMFDRLEFAANDVEAADPAKIAQELSKD